LLNVKRVPATEHIVVVQAMVEAVAHQIEFAERKSPDGSIVVFEKD
jgi:hypothetical protein